jgi:hypothetical protein
MNPKTRSNLVIVTALAVMAILAWGGFVLAHNAPVTEEQLSAYSDSVDLAKLSGVERVDALRQIEQKVNALPLAERRKWWISGHWRKWFDAMTDNEKDHYVDATLPTGFKQVMDAFETLPDERRKQAIEDALHGLKEKHILVTDHEPGHAQGMYGTNAAPVLSAELENRARMLGVRTFFADSSAETKAELAPVIEELQHQLGGKSGLQ